MKDVIIKITQPDGSELEVSTDMIEENVLRMYCGLDAKED